MFDEIRDLEVLHERKKELSALESALTAPKLKDLELIPKIYDWFCESCNIPKEDIEPWYRQQFIFIILYLYSVQKLAKGKMMHKLRIALTNVIGVPTKTTISNDCTDLYFLYCKYSDFHTSIDQSYLFIKQKLEINGLASGL